MKKFVSIKRKMITNTMIIIAVIFAAVLAIITLINVQSAEKNIRNSKKNIRNALVAKGSTLTGNNSRAMMGMAGDNAITAIRELVSSTVASDAEIVYGIYMDADFFPWAYAAADNPSGAPQTKDPLTDPISKWAASLDRLDNKVYHCEKVEIVEFAAPVQIDGETFGYIRYGLSTGSMHEAIREVSADGVHARNQAILILAAIGILSFLASFLSFWRLAGKITQPIASLVESSRIIAGGNYNIPVTDDTPSHDEIGELAAAFNTMRNSIKEKISVLSRLTTIMDTTSDLVSMSKMDSQIIYMNSAGRKMVGWRNDEELAAKKIPDIHPEWALHVIEDIGIPEAVEKGLWQGETAVLGPDGNEIPASQVIMSHKSHGGEPEYLSTIMRDITERLRAEKAESEAKLLAREMELARTIQTGLLPGVVKNIHPDFEIAASMVTADRVGGDYYDITFDRKGNFWISIGDVSGHGLKPGLIMMMAQTIHATVTSSMNCEARDVVVMINEILFRNVHNRLKEKHFMTFNALKYLGDGKFEHAGAHLRIIVFRREAGQCELIRTNGIYLNLKEDISKPIKNSYFDMGEDDVMVLYTDGLTEAQDSNGELLDIDRFLKIVEKHVLQDTESMNADIIADVLKWCDNKRDDDMTLVIVKRKGDTDG
jgi:PAS domain S-box-containing protein